MQNKDWYIGLAKPFLTPPDAVFPIAWTILYIMIFASLFLFLKTGNLKNKIKPLLLFSAQMGFNFLWTPLFFHMKLIGFALIDVILMEIFVVLTIVYFYKHSKTSSYLLIPYALWSAFAIYLNAGIFILNRQS